MITKSTYLEAELETGVVIAREIQDEEDIFFEFLYEHYGHDTIYRLMDVKKEKESIEGVFQELLKDSIFQQQIQRTIDKLES